uniref:Uncharacterized protein n=1 Tax=Timema monikensis TaxID=170555 RepID=A0A7R9EE30_9NEOP|nr:unnamed protein product [Timema monikensis]
MFGTEEAIKSQNQPSRTSAHCGAFHCAGSVARGKAVRNIKCILATGFEVATPKEQRSDEKY